MPNLLSLVNTAREECDAAGSGDLTTLVGVSGESLRFKNWIIRAWEEIQEKHTDWRWMKTDYSFVTTANDGSYTSAQAGIASRFDNWDKTFCTVYTTSAGTADQTRLQWIDYDTFRNTYLVGSHAQLTGRPMYFTSGPANELLLGPKPDSALYTVAGQYHKSPQTLSANTDEPELPDHQRVIVYRAMKKYARFSSAPEIYQDAENHERELMAQIMAKYLPMITMDGPLV